MGGALHEPRRPGAQGRDSPEPGRDDRHRRRHLAAAARRRALRHRRVSAAAAHGPRQSRLRGRRSRECSGSLGGRPPLLQVHDVPVGRHRISTLTMGRGPDVLLLHGLGGTRASLFETAAALSRSLPGARARPAGVRVLQQAGARRAYNARWFAEIIVRADGRARESRRPRGRQLDGRAGRDRGRPDRARAGRRARPAVPSGRLACGAGYTRSSACSVPSSDCSRTPSAAPPSRRSFWSMFHDRDLIDPAVADLVVDEFLRIYHSAGARYAFLAAARNIYLEAPFGRNGFYPRLADLRPPALFVWGSHDRLVPPTFRRMCANGCRAPSRSRSRVRPRAAGRAPRGDERAAAGLLPPRASTRRQSRHRAAHRADVEAA